MRLIVLALALILASVLIFSGSAMAADGGTDGGSLPSYAPCTSTQGVTPSVPGGCLSCAVGAFCCANSGACTAPGQSVDQFCPYSGNFPQGCRTASVDGGPGACSYSSVCQHVLPPAGPHTITFTNATGQDIWVAGFSTGGSPADFQPIGTWNPMWYLKDKQTQAITVPFSWANGRFWARTGCLYNPKNQATPLVCKTGDCKGQINCAVSGNTPATLTEFTMMGGNGQGVDNYDVSMVDGFNVIASIVPKPKTSKPNGMFCGTIACTKTPSCWAKGTVPGGCQSPCKVIGDTKHCCKCDMTTSCSCETGIPPAGTCCVNPTSYGCSPFFLPGQSHPASTICDYDGKHGRPDAAWDVLSQMYVDNIQAACPGVYGWQFHDMTSLFTCVDPVAPVDYQVNFGK